MEQSSEELMVDRDVLIVYLTTQFGEQVLELRNEVHDIRDERGELEAEITRVENERVTLVTQNEELEAEITRVKDERDTLLTQKGTLETEIRMVRDERNTLLTQKRTLETEIRRVRDERKTLLTQKGTLETEIRRARDERNTLLTQKRTLETENLGVKKERDDAVQARLDMQKQRNDLGSDLEKAIKTNEDSAGLVCNLREEIRRYRFEANNPNQLMRCCIWYILLYFVAVSTFCYYHMKDFEGMDDGNLSTVLYFVLVVTLSIGYGDIVPTTPGAKLFTCLLVVLGAQISVGLISVQCYVWKVIKTKFLGNISDTTRTIITWVLPVIAILISVFAGMCGIEYLENGKGDHKLLDNNMNGTDSFYMSMMSLSTEGFGDFSFKTQHGRAFAVVWLSICQPMYVSALTHFVQLIASSTRSFFPGCFYSF